MTTMTAMDVAVGAVALVLVFAGVLIARTSRQRARHADPGGGTGSGRVGGLLVMAVGLFFAMNVTLWLLLPALAVAEAARRLADRAAS